MVLVFVQIRAEAKVYTAGAKKRAVAIALTAWPRVRPRADFFFFFF